ncbi:uncharacterized protein LOC144448457 isoform X2 [Glandiceps talaboti]
MACQALFIFIVLLQVIHEIKMTQDAPKTVRLVGDPTPYSGKVEIYLESEREWIPVVGGSPNWHFTDAEIACNELGHPGAMWHSTEKSYPLFGSNRKRIQGIQCNGNETTLSDCDYQLVYTGNDYFDQAKTRCNYYGYLGCYETTKDDPVLPFPKSGYQTDHMTIQSCLLHCRNNNMIYAGLRFAYCYCGQEGTEYWKYGKLRNDECDDKCKGDETQACGGQFRRSIYRTTLGTCGGQTNGSGTIYSPGFPGQYSESTNCTWNVITQPMTVIRLEFIIYNIIESDHIYMYEYDGDQYHTEELIDKRIWSCSNNIHIRYVSTENEMFALEVEEVNTDCQPLSGLSIGPGFYNHSCPYFHGDVISVICDPGYVVDSDYSSIVCQQNGMWNDSLPVCTVTDCGDPGDVNNALSYGNNFTYNNTVRFMCLDGFYLVGHDFITCTTGGQWTEKPTCLRKKSVLPVFPSTPDQEARSFHETAIIAGTSVGITFVIVTVLLVVCCFMRRRLLPCLKSGNTSGGHISHQNEVVNNETVGDNEHAKRPNICMKSLNKEEVSERLMDTETRIIGDETGEQIIGEGTTNNLPEQNLGNTDDHAYSYGRVNGNERVGREGFPYEISDDAPVATDNTYESDLNEGNFTAHQNNDRGNGASTAKPAMNEGSVWVRNIVYESADELFANLMDDSNRVDSE